MGCLGHIQQTNQQYIQDLVIGTADGPGKDEIPGKLDTKAPQIN
jgi:hypothetical protein